jgi:hypothetical protein
MARLRRDRGEVSVAMINVSLGHLDDLHCPWGDGEGERVPLPLLVSRFLRCLGLCSVKRIVTDLIGFPDLFTSLGNLGDSFVDVVSLCSHAHEGGYGSAFVVHLVWIYCVSLQCLKRNVYDADKESQRTVRLKCVCFVVCFVPGTRNSHRVYIPVSPSEKAANTIALRTFSENEKTKLCGF